MWSPQHVGNVGNLASTRYEYRLHPSKPFPTEFRNHLSLVTTSYPALAGFTSLSDGASRDFVLRRYLSVTDDATITVNEKSYSVPKRLIVLIECLADGVYRVSIPVGSSVEDEPTEEIDNVDADTDDEF